MDEADDHPMGAAVHARGSRDATGPTDSPASGRRGLTADETAVDALLAASHLAVPNELPKLESEQAAHLGAEDALVYLVDLQQRVLVPFIGPGGPSDSSEPLAVWPTLAGRGYQHVEILAQPVEGILRILLLLFVGTQRLGVLALTMPPAALGADDEPMRARL